MPLGTAPLRYDSAAPRCADASTAASPIDAAAKRVNPWPTNSDSAASGARSPRVRTAHAAWRKDPTRPLPYGDFGTWREKNAAWLASYATFSALKDHFGGKPWWEWPEEVRSFAAAALTADRGAMSLVWPAT